MSLGLCYLDPLSYLIHVFCISCMLWPVGLSSLQTKAARWWMGFALHGTQTQRARSKETKRIKAKPPRDPGA